MKTTNNTVLITGGSAGIGLEIAKQLLAKGNKVIIVGRDKKRLENALAVLPGATGIVSDVSKSEDATALVSRIEKDFPGLNLLINNAGYAGVADLANTTDAYTLAEGEILTNYLAIVRLNEKLLPILKKQAEAAIVNVSSVVAFVPSQAIPTYSASKAALHSYTQSLRLSLDKASAVKVFELMPPLVNTEFSKEIGGENGIHPSVVADDLLKALESDTYEIRVGNTENIYQLHLSSPANALAVMNGLAVH
jgi:uncharacterized oxidoreductase